MTDYTDTDETMRTIPQKKGKDKELLVVQATGFFKHTTGDTYDGFFEAKKKDKSVKMNGPGTYTTNEGDSYTGIWENDKFGYGGEEVIISYNSGAKYEGFIKDWSYHGKGRYTYPDGSVLSCDFEYNCPVGQLKLTDPNGHLWLSKAEHGFAWFEPVNHYYDILDSVIDKAEIRRRRRECNRFKQPPIPRKASVVAAAAPPSKSLHTVPTADQKKKVRIGGQQSKVL